MRKVLIRECKGGKWDTEYTKTGIFHGWGIDFVEFESGPAHYTVAIVEMSDGTAQLLDPKAIKFVNQAPSPIEQALLGVFDSGTT